jgi:hypothetical protein
MKYTHTATLLIPINKHSPGTTVLTDDPAPDGSVTIRFSDGTLSWAYIHELENARCLPSHSTPTKND